MSYQAFNNFVIAVPEQVENVSTSGIITSGKSTAYRVVATNDTTKELQNKLVVAKEMDQLDAQYFAIDYQKIVAVKE